MKQQRLRIKLIAVLLFTMFALLAAFGVYSVMTNGSRWFSSRWNPRVTAQKENVTAGKIIDRDGVILAETLNGKRTYQADEASRRAVVHVVGDEYGRVANGAQTFQTAYLYGFQTSLIDLAKGLIHQEPRVGDDVTLTIDSRLSTAITQYFSASTRTLGHNGAAVVLNYKTGETLALLSLPTFDPTLPLGYVDQANEPFWNRATQAKLPPGSTFKIVTSAAMLQSNPNSIHDTWSCRNMLNVGSGTITDAGNTVHGQLNMQQAFAQSCNQTYASMALSLGAQALKSTAQGFGFGDNFLFRDLVVENSICQPSSTDAFALAILGFGQGRVCATPLHMALISASVANNGMMMEPRLLMQVTSPGGREKLSYTPSVYRHAMDSQLAGIISDMMRSAVESGTASRARISGMDIRGKTGTSQNVEDGEKKYYGWFTGFCADEDTPFAVCVMVEDIAASDSGGNTAAPIAGSIFSYLREHHNRVVDESLLTYTEPTWAEKVESAMTAISDMVNSYLSTPQPTALPSATPSQTAIPQPTTLIDAGKDAINTLVTDAITNAVRQVIGP